MRITKVILGISNTSSTGETDSQGHTAQRMGRGAMAKKLF